MLMIRDIVTDQPIKIASSNTKKIIGIQLLVFFLSKKHNIRKLMLRILEWGGASLLVQFWARNYIKTPEVRHIVMPAARAGVISTLLGRNIQIWIICDAIAKNMFHYLRLFNIPGPNIILCSLASSEIITNWLLYSDRLLPSYKTFLDFQGMSDYSGMENNKQLQKRFYNENTEYKTTKEVINRIMPNGSLRWIMYHYFYKSVPFYFSLHTLQSAFAMKLNPSVFARNLASSSSFLTAFCYIAYKQGEFTIDRSEYFLRGGLLLPGIALMLERNSLARRSISHYCMCMAIYSYLKDDKMLGFYNYLIGTLTDYNQLRTLINMV
tara:strand:- start:1430 stop:2398 length:969 start_codon:yes stop_codon:yes gene_type:complete